MAPRCPQSTYLRATFCPPRSSPRLADGVFPLRVCIHEGPVTQPCRLRDKLQDISKQSLWVIFMTIWKLLFGNCLHFQEWILVWVMKEKFTNHFTNICGLSKGSGVNTYIRCGQFEDEIADTVSLCVHGLGEAPVWLCPCRL